MGHLIIFYSFLKENVSVMEDLVMTFMLLLFQIWHKSHDIEYKPDLAASVVRLPKRVNDSPPSQVNFGQQNFSKW